MRTPIFITGASVGAGDHGLLGLRLLRRLFGQGGQAKAPTQPTRAIGELPPIDVDGEDTSLTQAVGHRRVTGGRRAGWRRLAAAARRRSMTRVSKAEVIRRMHVGTH